ncbi:MAG: winged helix-turn-helix transcriptional regulator [Candidatus Heimdallarchaeaceae archaeon]
MLDSICQKCNKRLNIGPYCLNRSEPILDFLSAKWSFHVISILAQDGGFMRFNEVEKRLKEGGGTFSPRTLTSRLREAEKLELITRTVYPEIPPKVEYSLTEKGRAFYQAVIPLLKWVVKWTEHNC